MAQPPSTQLPPAVRPARPAPRPDTPLRLNLAEAINRALAANRNLANSRDQQESARLGIVMADADFELKIYPVASMGLGNSDTSSQNTYALGLKLEKRLAYGTTLSATPAMSRSDDQIKTGVEMRLSQPLLRGISREYNLSALHGAEFADRTARRAYYVTQVDTVLETVHWVYEVIRQRELVRLNEEAARRLRGFAEAAQAKEKAGLATPIDVFRSNIQLKQAKDSLTSARESLADAADSLKVLLSLKQEEVIEVEAPLAYQSLRVNEDQGVTMALDNRVELEQASEALNETKRLARVAKHKTWPDLTLALNYMPFATNDSNERGSVFDRQSKGLSLTSGSDISRTSERAAHQQSLLAVEAARRGLDLKRDEVVRQVRREMRSLRRAQERITNQQEQIAQAEGQLELAQVKFSHGLADNFTLLEAETQLRRAQTTLLSTVVDYIVGSYRLRGAIGSLVERHRARVELNNELVGWEQP